MDINLAVHYVLACYDFLDEEMEVTMATFTSKAVVQELLDNDGKYPGDPPAARIYEYRNLMSGEVAWAVFYDEAHDDIQTGQALASEWVMLWDRQRGHRAPIGALGGG